MSLNAKKILLTLSLVAVFGFSVATTAQAQEMKQNDAAPMQAKKKTTKGTKREDVNNRYDIRIIDI